MMRQPSPQEKEPRPLDGGSKILLARIGAAHGVAGEVRVKSFSDDPLALKAYGPLSAADGRILRIERMRLSKDVVIVKFRGVDDRSAAEALSGVDLHVDRRHLPPAEDDEFYHADLIGLAALTENGESLGSVVAVHNFGAGDILDIAPSRGPSLLVPFTRAAVPHIDIAAGHLTVAPPAADEDDDGQSIEGDAE